MTSERSASVICSQISTGGARGSSGSTVFGLVSHRKGEFRELFAELRGRGYARVRIDGQICDLGFPHAGGREDVVASGGAAAAEVPPEPAGS